MGEETKKKERPESPLEEPLDLKDIPEEVVRNILSYIQDGYYSEEEIEQIFRQFRSLEGLLKDLRGKHQLIPSSTGKE